MGKLGKEGAVDILRHAGCRIPGFGNGCTGCPIREKTSSFCGKLSDDEFLEVARFLYNHNSVYKNSVNIEIKEDYRLMPYVQISAKVV